jgi:hypothetical protein
VKVDIELKGMEAKDRRSQMRAIHRKELSSFELEVFSEWRLGRPKLSLIGNTVCLRYHPYDTLHDIAGVSSA